jgi:serine/threonine protein kinase
MHSPESNSRRQRRDSRNPRKPFIHQYLEDFDAYDAPIIGMGGSAVVLAVNEHLAIKQFGESSTSRKELRRELKILKRLSSGKTSPHILEFYGRWENGIVMERLEMTLHLRLGMGYLDLKLQDQWMMEVSKGLAFMHRREVLHGDLSCHNVLVDSHGHAKICDFAGSRLGDRKATARYQVRNQHPRYLGRQPNIATELFALGSLIFQIATFQLPYEHLPDATIRKHFEDGEFPLNCIDRAEIRDIVEDCWRGHYSRVSEVCKDLELL